MNLSSNHRKLAKLAVLIHEQLEAPPREAPYWQLPDLTWMEAQRELKCRRIAQQRGWRLAEEALQTDLRLSVERLIQELRYFQGQLMPKATGRPASTQEIYFDLLGLNEEFGNLNWNRRGQMLSVTTEPITLEGRYLGPFGIELDLQRLTPHPTYSVVAQDPQPSGVNSDVCHPHVQGEQLCEGEGVMAICTAIQQGRLLDFFVIIRNLLLTYNSSSPYVSLEEWDGSRCSECDYSLREDEGSCCGRCESTLCDECVRICCECGESACCHCSHGCSGCDDDVCTRCEKQCADCNQTFCPSCLQDDERCHSCHEAFQEENENEITNAAVHPVCMGKTAVPAGSG